MTRKNAKIIELSISLNTQLEALDSIEKQEQDILNRKRKVVAKLYSIKERLEVLSEFDENLK